MGESQAVGHWGALLGGWESEGLEQNELPAPHTWPGWDSAAYLRGRVDTGLFQWLLLVMGYVLEGAW